jgi:hypothetical protein
VLTGFNGDDIEDFVALDDDGTDTTVMVSADGAVETDGTALVVLEGVSGLGLQDLLDGGHLVVDSAAV